MNIFSNGINYADGETPTVMSSAIEAVGYEGWYYKNSAHGKHISWYIPLGKIPFFISDLTSIYASIHIRNKTSLPFIIVYTAPIGFNDAGKWYHSKTVYTIPETEELENNSNYCFFINMGKMTELSIDGHTNVELVANSEKSSGKYTATNIVKYVAFCTNDDVAPGEVDFILSDINVIKKSGNIELFLSNSELFSSNNVNLDSLILSKVDNRKPGVSNNAFHNPLSVTKVEKNNATLHIGHNGLFNDTIIDNLKFPRLANVAGKSDSSVSNDNINTIFNNFFLTLDFSVDTDIPNAQFTVEAWGLDCTSRVKVFIDVMGNIKIMYRGVDLFSNGNVLPGDIILDKNMNPTLYGWTTHVFPGSLIPGNWYRIVQTIHFSEELYGDKVNTRLYELTGEDGNIINIVLWDVIDNTWEAFYVNHPSQAVNGNMPPSVDSIQIHCCDAPLNTNIASIKNITYSTSKTIPVPSLDYLMPTERGIVTFLSGNSTNKSLTEITGLQYLFEASGGYLMERGFDKITRRTQDLIQRYDVTDSVQVKLNVNMFNTKLGVVKDASNINIISSTFNTVSDTFPTDSITINSSEFINGLTVNNIISVGKYSTMYSDFISYVRKYFGYSGGFSSLFKAASEFDISGGVFNAQSFVDLVSGGNTIVANDINNVDKAPSLFYKMTRSDGKMYEEVAQDFTGSIISNAVLNNNITKWGHGSLNAIGGNGVLTDKYIVPGVSGMTFSFWVNIQNNDSNQNYKLFSLGDTFNMTIRGLYLLYPYINCTNGNGYSSAINFLYGFICGTWNYITLTVDPSGQWKFYLNGNHKQTINIDSTGAFGYPSFYNALQLQIGGSEGYYNDFLYYDRILSSTEVTELYSNYINNGSTITSWVKFSSLNNVPQIVWSFYDTINENTISLYATDTKYTVKYSRVDLSNVVFDVNSTPVVNSWTHIAAVFDNGKTQNTWTVYINNTPFSNTIDAFNNYLPQINLSNTINAVGMDASSGLYKMHGYVDDVTIYNKALSSSKITYIYNGLNTLCKVADYSFDTDSISNYSIANSASGTPIYDASITNLSLLNTSAPKYGNGCLYFPDGSYTGEVVLGKMDFPDQGEFSFSTWVKFTNINSSGTPSTVFSMYSNNGIISLYADVSNYTLAILNKKSPIYIDSVPIQNNNFSNTANTVISGLEYPYCRNGTYTVTTSNTGFSAGNSIYEFFNNTGTIINTGAVYSASNGSYTGYTNSVLNTYTDTANVLYGMTLYSDSAPRYSFNSFSMAVSYTNILGLDINSDGTRVVFYVGTNIYWATRNPTNGSIGTISSLVTNKVKIHSIALKPDGSRIFVSANDTSAIYYSDWVDGTYTALQSIYSTSANGNISCNSNGTRLLLTPVYTFNGGLSQPMKNYYATFNGTSYDFTQIESGNYYVWGSAMSPDGSRIGFCGYDTSTSPTYVPLYFYNWNGTSYDSKTEIDYSSIPRTALIKINRMKFSSNGRVLFVAVTGGVTGNTNLFYSCYNSGSGNYGTFYPLYYSAISSDFPSGNVNASIAIRNIDENNFEVFLNRYQVSTVHALSVSFNGASIAGEYMQISLPYNLNLTNYFLNSRYANYMPKTFYVLGSEDGNLWEILSYNTNVSIVDIGRISGRGVLYNITNTKFHKHFRIVVAQTNNTAAAYLYNMRMSGFVQESIDYEFGLNAVPVINEWTHVAGTLSNNKINSTIKMYVNNVLQTITTDSNNILLPAFGIDSSYNRVILGMDKIDSEVTFNSLVLDMDKAGTFNEYFDQINGTTPLVNQWSTNSPMYIKQIFGEVEYINKMNGYIDGIKFFNSSLSASQITNLYYNQTPIETALAKYNFNTETVVNNEIANYASGTLVYDSSLTNLSLISSTGQRSGSGALYFPNTSYAGSVRLGNFTYDNPIDVYRKGAVWNYTFDASENDAGYINDTTSGLYNMYNLVNITPNVISSEKWATLTPRNSLKANGGTTAVYYNNNPFYTIPKLSALTFAFWVYINSNTNNNGKGVIGLSNANGTSAINVKISGTNTFYLSLQTTFNGITTTNTPSRPISPETWTYVCWSITTDGTWKYYINGDLKDTIIANVKPYFSATQLFAASARGTAGFYGYLDEYRYYERELSSDEILSQYKYYTVDPNAVFTSDLSGSITISNINLLLRNAVDANVFGNRTPNSNTGTAGDPVYKSNYGVNDGFIDGDIIWVPSGTSIKLSVGIDVESFLPINNIGPSLVNGYGISEDSQYSIRDFLQTTTATTTKISRTIKAPLMIRVSNM